MAERIPAFSTGMSSVAAGTLHIALSICHCLAGVIHRDAGRLKEAVACYEAALAAAPNFAIVQQNLAIALTELGTRAKLAGTLELPLPNMNVQSCLEQHSSRSCLPMPEVALLAARVCAWRDPAHP